MRKCYLGVVMCGSMECWKYFTFYLFYVFWSVLWDSLDCVGGRLVKQKGENLQVCYI